MKLHLKLELEIDFKCVVEVHFEVRVRFAVMFERRSHVRVSQLRLRSSKRATG